MAIQLITEAVNAGARRHKACAVLGLSCRTLRRWSQPNHELRDQRGQAARDRVHPQALTPQERLAIVQVCNSPEHASLPPSQIVPKLADRGHYLASESSFYRVLKAYRCLSTKLSVFLSRFGQYFTPTPMLTRWVKPDLFDLVPVACRP
jgi:hypothetical protein